MVKKLSPIAQKALDHYSEEGNKSIKAAQLNQLAGYRQDALTQFKQVAFPTQKDEAWQYTRLNALLKHSYTQQVHADINEADVAAFLPDFEVFKVVFIDGYYNATLSDDKFTLPAGVTFKAQQEVFAAAEYMADLYANQTAVNSEPFGALNSIFANDGFYLHLANNTTLDIPVFVLHLQTTANQLASPKNKIVLAENAELKLIERYASLFDDTQSALTNVVTHIHLEAHARFNQVLLQQQNLASFYFNNQFIEQHQQSVFNTFFGSHGSHVARHQNHLWMQGTHIENEQNSACLGQHKQTVDSRTFTVHKQEWGLSRQLHKYVLTDQATGVFDGMIHVDKAAQKTDGQMDNKNLLLSDTAKMATKPQLEIYADDVKCSHGSASGEIDENQIFYLQARGIKRADALKMITHAFLLEPAESIKSQPVRRWVTAQLSQGLAQIDH